MARFSIVIPVFNEAKNITNLLDEIHLNLKDDDYEIIIVNDCSVDDTSDVIENYNKKSNLILINNKSNRGQSYSINKAINIANCNTILTIDGDGQNDPKDINNLLETYFSDSNYSLVAGIRSKRKDNLIKIISSKIANYLRSKILKDNCKDTGCSLKIFDKTVFLEFPYFDGIHRFLPSLFEGYGKKTFYIKVGHRFRANGKSNYGTLDRLFRGLRDIIKVYKILKNKKINA